MHVVGMCSMWRCAGTCACKVQSSSKVDIYITASYAYVCNPITKLTLDQTCKTCNPSVPIGTWGADPRISQLGGFVSPPPHIYTLYNCYNPPLPLPCAVLRAQRGGRGYSYQLAGVKCVSGVRSDFPVFFLAPGKPYRVHVILSTTTQIAFRKKTKTSLTPLRQRFKIISMHLF